MKGTPSQIQKKSIEKQESEHEDIEILEITDLRYPAILRSIGKDAPAKLYCIGDISLMERRCTAVVGARKASQYGKWAAYNIGRILAQYGIVTVSGMAYGCDSQAHAGALDSGGKTIAVLGCGVDICYPQKNAKLRKRIIDEGGLILSEYPPGTLPMPYNFPRRNRIISGLSELTVVAEASLASGSLITAGCAAEQGRDVMAVPGNINGAMSLGCNRLIQDGVSPVTCMDDIISALNILPDITDHVSKKAEKEMSDMLGDDEKAVFDMIKNNGEVTSDYIALSLDRSIAEINGIVTILAIKGFVSEKMGKISISKKYI